MKTRSALLAVVHGIFVLSATANAICLTAIDPYENHYGWAIFPFMNTCADSVSVSLCVKSWPPGSSDPVYNSYAGTVSGNDTLELTDGMWRTYESHKWQENAYQICPFE